MVEIKWNMSQVKESKDLLICEPKTVRAECCDMSTMAQESFQILTLNPKSKLIDRHLITLGLADSSLVHPREVFRPAILDGASSIILVHNHPSGDPTPSVEDIRITRQLIEAGNILGIKILDHIVIGRGSTPFISLRENGLANF